MASDASSSNTTSGTGSAYADWLLEQGTQKLCTEYEDCTKFLVPVLVTSVVGSILTGVILSQAWAFTWVYYCKRLRATGVLCIVWLAVAFQIISTAADATRVVEVFGLNFGNYASFAAARPADAVIYTANASAACVTQSFLLLRAFRFSRVQPKLQSGRLRIPLLALMAACAALIVLSFVGCLIAMIEVQIIGNQMLLAFRDKQTRLYAMAMPLWLASATVVDVSLAGIIFWELYLPRNERSHRFSALHDRIVTFLALITQSGVVLAALQLAVLAVWQHQLAQSDPTRWSSWMYLPQAVLGRYYTITLLVVVMMPHAAYKSGARITPTGTLSRLNDALNEGRGARGAEPLSPEQAIRLNYELECRRNEKERHSKDRRSGSHLGGASGGGASSRRKFAHHFPGAGRKFGGVSSHGHGVATVSFIDTLGEGEEEEYAYRVNSPPASASPTKARHEIFMLQETKVAVSGNASTHTVDEKDALELIEKKDLTDPANANGKKSTEFQVTFGNALPTSPRAAADMRDSPSPFFQPSPTYASTTSIPLPSPPAAVARPKTSRSRLADRRPSSTLVDEEEADTARHFDVCKEKEYIDDVAESPSSNKNAAGGVGKNAGEQGEDTRASSDLYRFGRDFSDSRASSSPAHGLSIDVARASPTASSRTGTGERFSARFPHPPSPFGAHVHLQVEEPLSPSHVIGSYSPPRFPFERRSEADDEHEHEHGRRDAGRLGGRGARDDERASSDVEDAFGADDEEAEQERRAEEEGRKRLGF